MPAHLTPVRAPALQWVRTALISANILWTTLCLGGFLPGTRAVMTVLTAALVAVHLADTSSRRRAHPAGWLFVPFLAFAAANAAWVTPVRWLGWFDWLNWAQAVALFWIVLNGVEAPSCRRFLCAFLVALGVTCAVLAAYQHFVKPEWLMLGRTQAQQFIGRSSGPFGIPNSLGVLMALLIPPVAWLVFAAGRPPALRALCGVALAFLAAAFVLAVSRGAWLTLGAALALRPLVSPGRSLGRRVAVAGAAAVSALAAAALLYVSFPLMHERFGQLLKDAGERTRPILWRGAWRIFEAHPVVGAGAGSFDALFEAYRPEGYRDQPYYAHCDYLNTLADYGLMGFVLLFGAVTILAWRCSRARGLAGAAFTGLLAFALHLIVDFHLKIPALAMIVATVAALVTADAWQAPAASPVDAAVGSGLGRWTALFAAAAFLLLAFTWAVPKYRAEELRQVARARIDAMAATAADVSREGENVAQIRGQLARAVAADPQNAQAWSDMAYADSLWALVNPNETSDLGAKVEEEGRRAVELSPVIAEFWIRRGTGFDMQRRSLDAGACFVRALQLAPVRADVWYYQAYHLSLAQNGTGHAVAAAEFCLRLDPSFRLAQALRQRLEARQ